MNCDEFAQRMHQRLDDRLSLASDGELRRHACQCPSCRAELHAWRRIASVMPVSSGDVRPTLIGNRYVRTVSAIAGLAAAILFALVVVGNVEDSRTTAIDSAAVDDHETALAQQTSELDPALWWRDVQDRDWVRQTMPAVRSVQQSVAPIGRSLMRAVTILTVGGREQTS